MQGRATGRLSPALLSDRRCLHFQFGFGSQPHQCPGLWESTAAYSLPAACPCSPPGRTPCCRQHPLISSIRNKRFPEVWDRVWERIALTLFFPPDMGCAVFRISPSALRILLPLYKPEMETAGQAGTGA